MFRQKILSFVSFAISFLLGVGLTSGLVTPRMKGSLTPSGETTAHSSRITALATSPGGKYMASGSLDGRLKVWSIRNEALAWKFDVDSPVLSIAFSRSGYKLSVLTRKGKVFCFSTITGERWDEHHPFPPETIEGGALGYLGDEPSLMAYGDEALKKWAEQSGNTGQLKPFETGATCLNWSPAAEIYAVGTRSGQVKIFNKSTNEELHVWDAGIGPVSAVALSRDGSLVAYIGSEGLEVRDIQSGSVVSTAPLTQSGVVSALAFTPTNKYLVCGDSTGRLLRRNLGNAAAMGIVDEWTETVPLLTPAHSRCGH
ncbi:MAG: hypothetical protein K1Y36_07750 [Blastocatellia bacterium]|nr:hypothetical protein [Blastocatellia bacterium]